MKTVIEASDVMQRYLIHTDHIPSYHIKFLEEIHSTSTELNFAYSINSVSKTRS